MHLSFQKEIVELLFEPERLMEIKLREPDSHIRYIQAYAHLEFQEGFLSGIMVDKQIKPMLEETVDFFVRWIRTNQMENIIAFYEESKKEKTKYSTVMFFVFLHQANKLLNRYGLQ